MGKKRTKDTAGFLLEHLMAGLGPAVLKSIRAPFAIISSDLRVLWINKAMAYIHGHEEEEALIGTICRDTFDNPSTTA